MKALNDNKLPNEVGIDPLSELELKLNSSSDVNALIVLGIVPVREHKGKEMMINDVMPPMEEGIDPVIEFTPITRRLSFVKALIVLARSTC